MENVNVMTAVSDAAVESSQSISGLPKEAASQRKQSSLQR